MDPGDRVLAAAKALQPEFFAGRAVFIDEFDTFNAPKRRLLEAMLTMAGDVTVALCCDGMEDYEGGLGLFSGAKQMAAALRPAGTTACRWPRRWCWIPTGATAARRILPG